MYWTTIVFFCMIVSAAIILIVACNPHQEKKERDKPANDFLDIKPVEKLTEIDDLLN